MMKIKENHPRIWFKILANKGEPIDGSSEQWSHPFRQHNSDKMDFSRQPGLCLNDDKWVQLPGVTGTWLVSNPKELYPHNSERRIFVAELLSDPSHQVPGIIWVHKVRLIREATNLDLKRFGIYRAFRQIIDDEK